MNADAGRLGNSSGPAQSRLPSYKTGWGFLIAAVAEKSVGSLLAGAMAELGAGSGHGRLFVSMNQVLRCASP